MKKSAKKELTEGGVYANIDFVVSETTRTLKTIQKKQKDSEFNDSQEYLSKYEEYKRI